jgi:hypothetical protein
MPSAPKRANRSAPLGPYLSELVNLLPELVKNLKNEPPFLFVIAIAILLIVFTVSALALGSSDLRFIVLVITIALLALTVITAYFFKKVDKRQTLQGSEIRALQIALKGILTKHETGPLMGLNGPGKFEMRYEPDLYGYLHRLDGLDFIQPHKNDPGLWGIVEDHKRDLELQYEQRPLFDLKKYVYITDRGKDYLNLYLDILKKAKTLPPGSEPVELGGGERS